MAECRVKLLNLQLCKVFCYGSAPGFVDPLIGQPGIELGGRKFEYIGAPAPDTQLLIVHKRAGIKSVEEWLSHPAPVKFGSTAPVSKRIVSKDRQRSVEPAAKVVSG